jgi:membrane protein YdbS with pleckstrin-like domain
MPSDVKAYVSAAVAIVAMVLAYWSGSPVRPEFGNFVVATAAFMIVAMWIFPEAGGKKKSAERLRLMYASPARIS